MHRRQHELAVFAFDLMQLDREDLRPLDRWRLLERLLRRAKVPFPHLVETFDDGQELLEAAERHLDAKVRAVQQCAAFPGTQMREPGSPF